MGDYHRQNNDAIHDRLKIEVTRERNRCIAMHEASMALTASMRSPLAKKRAGLKGFLWPFDSWATVVREQREARLREYLSPQSNLPTYAKCSTLESLVLLQARSKMWGIKAVMIDYAEGGPNEAPNWRIIGFTNGMADREAAWLVIKAAAHEYARWVMVDDADPAAGQLVTPRP